MIGWVGLEANGEDIVGVISSKMQMPGARLVMGRFDGGELQLWYLLDALHGKAVNLLRWLWDIADCCIVPPPRKCFGLQACSVA